MGTTAKSARAAEGAKEACPKNGEWLYNSGCISWDPVNLKMQMTRKGRRMEAVLLRYSCFGRYRHRRSL